tara:strand:+ start:807 stop:1139 length:333 start_codon:yes stop_codon:yes gene_type:complete
MNLVSEMNKKVNRIHHLKKTEDLSSNALAKRLKIDVRMVRKVLNGQKVYPSHYTRVAARYGLPVEEVTEQMEQGNQWCYKCEAWLPREEFYEKGSGGFRHRGGLCQKKNG